MVWFEVASRFEKDFGLQLSLSAKQDDFVKLEVNLYFDPGRTYIMKENFDSGDVFNLLRACV